MSFLTIVTQNFGVNYQMLVCNQGAVIKMIFWHDLLPNSSTKYHQHCHVHRVDDNRDIKGDRFSNQTGMEFKNSVNTVKTFESSSDQICKDLASQSFI